MTQPGSSSSLDGKSLAAMRAGQVVLRALAHTWRFRRRGTAALESMRSSGSGFIFALWHGDLLPLLWLHRGEGVTVLVSEHRDGEMIARVADSLGYRLIRGSTTRGGGRAILAIVRELRSGGAVAITPDGPRGPRHTFAPGALMAANRAGASILPVAVNASRAWRLGSWDRLAIPQPLATVTVAYGMPTRIPGNSAREAARQAPVLERIMHDTAALACD